MAAAREMEAELGHSIFWLRLICGAKLEPQILLHQFQINRSNQRAED